MMGEQKNFLPLFLFILLIVKTAFGHIQEEVRTLEMGMPIERELSAGQYQIYGIKLEAGQFAKVIVEQLGIDVRVRVLRPDGKQLFIFDSEVRLRGQETVSLAADASGDYRLVVYAAQRKVLPGAYRIRIAEVRRATENDRALDEARQAFEQGKALRDADKYDQALPLLERALEIRERILGPGDAEVATAIHNLAVLCYYQGEYQKVEPLVKRALAIQEKALGPADPDLAASLNLLAVLYSNRGDYLKAEPLSIRALAIREEALGPNHPSIHFYLRSLASIYVYQREYRKAEVLYQRSLSLIEENVGSENAAAARVLTGLAEIYDKIGDDARAEEFHLDAVRIREKVLGPEHPSVAESLTSLANIYRDRRDYERAEPLYRRALAIQEKTLGPLRPHVARTLNQLAIFSATKGEIAQAIAVQSRANEITEYNLSLNISAGSERQKLAFLALLSDQTDFTLSLHNLAAPGDPEALKLAFTTLLRRKARGLDVMTDTIATLRRHATPEDQRLFDQLAEARSQLAALGEFGADLPESSKLQFKPLEEKIENLEADLSTRSAEFRTREKPVTVSAVQAMLPAASALVEFVSYTPRNLSTGEKSQPPRYLAYLLADRGEAKWADLGAAGPIDRAVAAWRQALRNPRRPDVDRLARIVDDRVMRPVRSSLQSLRGATGEIRRLLIAPDGSLNLIPFAALVDEQKRYLVERYTISYLTSGRDLLRVPSSAPGGAPLVLAYPDFGKVPPRFSRGENAAVKPYFQLLPETREEALAIKSVFPDAVILLKEKASEEALKQASAPRILHIATHGFFRNYPAKKSDESDKIIKSVDLGVENPLLRSGLALAGANRSGHGDDDGVLTALEAASLDLDGTKLVVLSACDTGVGELMKNGEGVQGLRRALVLAGSESQVMSLWPVSDNGSKELMIDYYKALRAGKGRSEGLRQVQLQMLRRPDRRRPFYWAAFIQSGEWCNLEGQR